MSGKAKKNRKSSPNNKRKSHSTPTNIPTLINKARLQLEKGRYADALDTLRGLDELLSSLDPHIQRETLYLAIDAALADSDFNELELWLAATTPDLRSEPRLKFARLRLHLGLREFSAAQQLAAELVGSTPKIGEFDHAELWLLKGRAEYECGEFAAATESLAEAAAIRPDFPEAYLDLARTRRALGDSDGERRALSDGLIRCTEKAELQILAEQFLDAETVSLCMIVKNEEEFLPRCLASVKNVVDEIIIVDTGSEDRTVEIAESFGAKVFHHPWQNSFSLHRNQSIEYATCDWVLILDADEELERSDIAKLKTATRIPDINIISVSVLNKNLETGELTSFLPSMRLWRRKLGCHYESIVHNELRIPDTEPVLRADIKIYHYGYSLEWDK
ncbi:MAG: glycosyltransferase, partial [bacterium]